MTDFSVRIAGSDEAVIPCEPGDTILRSALSAGFGFPYECNSGGCGSCAFEVLEGEIDELWEDAPGLSQRARKRGRFLACQSIPSSDCVIKVSLDDEYIVPVKPTRTGVTLTEVAQLTGDMIEFCFQTKTSANFVPGQFVLLDIPGVEGPRAFSMCNLPNEQGEWRFVIKRVPEGVATGVLFDKLIPISQHDQMTLDGPYGVSYLRPDSPRDIICIAGGSGLSPVLSILKAAVVSPKLKDKRLLLFYGGRGPKDLCVNRIIANDSTLTGRVEVFTAISEEGHPEWNGDRGFIHELIGEKLTQPLTDYEYYFCGPPQMTDAVHRMLLLEHKVPKEQMHFDRFV